MNAKSLLPISLLMLILAAAVFSAVHPQPVINMPAPSLPQISGGEKPMKQIIWEGSNKEELSSNDVRTLFAGQQPVLLSKNFQIPVLTAEAVAQIPVRIPDWNEEDWEHAAESRGSILKVLLVYELIRYSASQLYCGKTPYSQFSELRCLIVAHDPIIGDVGMIIVNDGTVETPMWGRAVTIIFNSGRGLNVTLARLSGCMSFKLFPIPPLYESMYDPPPVGQGKCLENH